MISIKNNHKQKIVIVFSSILFLSSFLTKGYDTFNLYKKNQERSKAFNKIENYNNSLDEDNINISNNEIYNINEEYRRKFFDIYISIYDEVIKCNEVVYEFEKVINEHSEVNLQYKLIEFQENGILKELEKNKNTIVNKIKDFSYIPEVFSEEHELLLEFYDYYIEYYDCIYTFKNPYEDNIKRINLLEKKIIDIGNALNNLILNKKE